MIKSPRISVIMTVYNTALFVEEAIMSILNQTYSDFELLIFNDGSKDNSSEVIQSIKDARIRFFDDKQNTGYVKRVNEGLRMAQGEYIARMDSDDIALPERFAKQIALMDDHPQIGVCGGSFIAFGDYDFVENLPVTDSEIRVMMLSGNPMAQSTILLRKSVLQKNKLEYTHSAVPVEDYWLWYECSKVTQLHNLPDILLKYRRHATQISVVMNDKQRQKVNELRIMQLTDKGFVLSEDEKKMYCRLLDSHQLILSDDFIKTIDVMNKIIDQNNILKAYNKDIFVNLFTSKWYNIVIQIQKYNPSYIMPVLINRKPVNNSFSFKSKLEFFVKSIIFWK